MDFGSIAVVALVVFLIFWYNAAINRLFSPVGKVLDASALHAEVYASEVANNAINRAADMQVDEKKVAKAKANVKLVSSFKLAD